MKYLVILLIIVSLGCKSTSVFQCHTGLALMDSVRESNALDFNYSFTEGTKQKLLGNYAQAINLFYHCLELQPKNAATCYQLAEVFNSNSDISKALFFAKKSLIYNPNNLWYNLYVAKLYQSLGRNDSAIIIYKRILKIQPNTYEYQFNLAVLYFKSGKINSSIKLLNKLKTYYGLNDEVALMLFQLYKVQHNSKSSIAILKDAIKLYPEETRFYGLMAEEYISLGKFDSSLVYYNKLFLIDPDNEKGLFSLIEYYRLLKDYPRVISTSREFIVNAQIKASDKMELFVEVLSNASLLECCRDSLAALITTAILLHPEEPRFHSLAADFYVKSNRFEDAKKELIYVAEKFPDNYLLYEQLLYVLNSLGAYNEIYNYTNKILSKFEDKPLVYLLRGIACFHLTKYSEAEFSLLTGLRYTRNSKELNIQFYTFLAEVYNGMKEYTKSDVFFEKVLKMDPTNLYVLNNYSYYLSLRGEYLGKAMDNIKKCMDLQPNSFHYVDTYAWILFRSGRVLESRNELEKVLKLGGRENPEILEHYIQVLYKLGEKKEAYRFYQILKDLRSPSFHINTLFENYVVE